MKILKKTMLTILTVCALLIAALLVFVNFPKFGKTPSGQRLERIRKSPHYRDGAFQNLHDTPSLSEGASYFGVLKEFIFADKIRVKPTDTLPSVKTNLRQFKPSENVLVWFGHSSYYMQIDGKKILVDPVLSGAASPIPSTTRSFPGTDAYHPEDFPDIDYLFISHDHWDHLDYNTLMTMKPRIGKIITGLGTGEHLETWGFDTARVVEMDWYEEKDLGEGFKVSAVPARHFSGRGLQRNKSLWTSFALQTPTQKIFIGGDSGYDTHFEEAGKKFGGFDLAILENGQYDKSWKYIHMQPDEVLKAAKDLRATRLFPVHSSKFALGNHSWDEPLKRITELNRKEPLPLVTPMIGQPVYLNDTSQPFSMWWQGLN